MCVARGPLARCDRAWTRSRAATGLNGESSMADAPGISAYEGDAGMPEKSGYLSPNGLEDSH